MCFEYNYWQARQFFYCNYLQRQSVFPEYSRFISMLPTISPKIKYQPLFKNSIKFFAIWVMPKLLTCMPSFPICFFESRDFCRINLIVSSSLQKFLTIPFTLDPLSASLSLRGMMLEITTSFEVDLTLFTSSFQQLPLEIHPS